MANEIRYPDPEDMSRQLRQTAEHLSRPRPVVIEIRRAHPIEPKPRGSDSALRIGRTLELFR